MYVLLPFLLRLAVRETRNEATDSLARRVDCDQCGVAYWYLVRKAAVGVGYGLKWIAEDRAARAANTDAERRVQQKLATETDPVPCPACGRYSEAAYPAVRRFRYRRGRWLPLALLLSCPFTLGPAVLLVTSLLAQSGGFDPDNPGTLTVIAAAGSFAAFGPGLGVFVWRFVRARRFDPNRDLSDEERFYLAGQRAAVAGKDGLPP